MGIPTDLRALARSGVLGPAELARVPLDSWLPGRALGDDVAVGPFVARRLGRAVVDRLIEPLLGGVYAGRADALSLEATLPQVAAQARRHRSLLAAASAARRAAPATQGPVFGSLRGGLGRLPAELVARSGADVRTGATARALRRTAGGWELVVGPARAPELLTADAVVLAVPAAAAARLLADELPAAAAALSGVAYSSMAVVTLALPAAPARGLPAGSGFLVPPAERLLVKAATFSSAKWGWYGAERPDLAVVRLSVGRLGEEADLQRDDAELVAAARADLATVTGVRAEPVDALVTRWGGALPQYAVGHRARVQRVREAVATVPGLAVCGAAYDGVGIPACVGSAGQAVAAVLGQWPHG
jgi:oxygen-dependent protoporphyrinogen oxidase